MQDYSKITARYSQPAAVSTALVAVTHFWLGKLAATFRWRCLGAKRPPGALLVVGLRRFVIWADQPSVCIKRTTRLRPPGLPRAVSTAWMRGLPST
jgi:hypothetical protein